MPSRLERHRRRLGGDSSTPSKRSATTSASCARPGRCTIRPAESPKVLDQDDAQRDRHRPQLADCQRLDVLVGADEAR